MRSAVALPGVRPITGMHRPAISVQLRHIIANLPAASDDSCWLVDSDGRGLPTRGLGVVGLLVTLVILPIRIMMRLLMTMINMLLNLVPRSRSRRRRR